MTILISNCHSVTVSQCHKSHSHEISPACHDQGVDICGAAQHQGQQGAQREAEQGAVPAEESEDQATDYQYTQPCGCLLFQI